LGDKDGIGTGLFNAKQTINLHQAYIPCRQLKNEDPPGARTLKDSLFDDH